MAYTTYSGLTCAADILAKMSAFASANGWSILEDCVDDLPIDGSGVTDGKKLFIKNGDVYGFFRTQHGKAIFPGYPTFDATNGEAIALIGGTGYVAAPPSGFWYDQANKSCDYNGNAVGCGVWIGKPDTGKDIKLFCNAITTPSIMLIFTIVQDGYYQHLAVGQIDKVGNWTGGAFISGTLSSYQISHAISGLPTLDGIANHMFATSNGSSTFIQAEVDSAPQRTVPVLWLNVGSPAKTQVSGYTGKVAGSHIVNHDCLQADWLPKIPHFGYLQSQSATDYGRDVNTLNCISVDLQIGIYAQRDPDALNNFSLMGYIPGVFAISMKNVAPGQLYEISYPQSGSMHQVFPCCLRGGALGYDGIAIKQ